MVGPSGIFSTIPYQRGDCSAQKYGPVKISCMHRILAPFTAASSMSLRCFSIESRLIFSRDSSVGVVQVAWISAQRTVLLMGPHAVGAVYDRALSLNLRNTRGHR